MSESTSLDLSARSAALALRVAALLEGMCSEESGAVQAAEFLRGWANTALDGRPADLSEPAPIDQLVHRYGLTPEELDLLMIAGLPEEHEGLASTFRSMHPLGEPQPTVGLAALLVGAPGKERTVVRHLLATDGRLLGLGLVELRGAGTFLERGIAPAVRLWDALHGYDAWPAAIERVAVNETPAGLEQWIERPASVGAVDALRSLDARTLVLPADDSVAMSRCAALAAACHLPVVAGRVGGGDRAAVTLLVAHAAARGAVPVLVLVPPDDGRPVPVLGLDGVPGPLLVCAAPGSAWLTGRRPVLTVPLGPIRSDDHRSAWRSSLPALADQAAVLAARHPLDPAATAEVAADVLSRQRLPGGSAGIDDVSNAIRGRAGVALPSGVDLATPVVPWERLVLPDEPAAQLHDAVARLDLGPVVLDDWGLLEDARADRGVRLMFTGPPGTGKSLAAEVVATAVGTDLLVVDVSRVVSKWIGETEKNLSAVFDAAERTQAVLLLDEADALFGTRTEISDAHDRYANLETAYLLQRLDRFAGLAVLATNLRQNIDAAFLRRMDYVVEFALPDEDGRADLWRLHLPLPPARADDVDVEALARIYPIPGGWIRNAAIGGAFLAAKAGGPIRQRHLVKALSREYAKATRPFPGEPVTLGSSSYRTVGR
ncbi:ATPase family protein associated with various cellular activities (AAA) [Kribbella orskensis]|uniref:ATPase family protein associated with various cellular activities (AAA) n=1 Tax=Kribbella orskensis TaxID=2512216 RepID=A0ABY2BA17_9ACTN|nr:MULTISPECIES: ATP-binding protein [Kribbella]TCN32790.1 ATPase family protein associated with various cellular activities (AAA) [Kribbella sp. VKM Ac-2500]TCO12892.1 ATPase family protein associated with various cellular activities (AAA) [Kribbella orskensis]